MVVDSRCVGSTVCFNFFVHFFGDMWNIKKKSLLFEITCNVGTVVSLEC